MLLEIATIGVEIGKVAVEAAAKESIRIAEESLKKRLAEGLNKELRMQSERYIRELCNPTEKYMRQRKMQELKKDLESVENNGDEAGAIFKKMMSDSNMKGIVGEHAAEVGIKHKFGGDIQRQIATGNNIVDFSVKETAKNAYAKELIIQNGEMVEKGIAIPRGKSVSFEIKNGGLEYLQQEVRSGHLLDQIRAGNELAEHSLVGIRTDVFKQLKESTTGIQMLEQILDAGGHIVPLMPDEITQFMAMKGMN